MVDKIFKNNLEHSLLDAKGIKEKYSSVSCNNFLNKKWAWPCCAFLGDAVYSTKISKIFWTTAYSMQKKSWKNIHPFSCSNFINKKWAWFCHALRDADRKSTMHLQTLLMYILSYCKKNFEMLPRSKITKILCGHNNNNE